MTVDAGKWHTIGAALAVTTIIAIDVVVPMYASVLILGLVILWIGLAAKDHSEILFSAAFGILATAIPLLTMTGGDIDAEGGWEGLACISVIAGSAVIFRRKLDILDDRNEQLSSAVALANHLRNEKEEAHRKTIAMASVLEDLRLERARLQGETRERRVAEIGHARLAAIVKSCELAVVGHTIDGTITSWNSSADSICGYSAEEMEGNSLRVLFHDDHQVDYHQLIEQIRKGQSIDQLETIFRREDGTCLDVSLTASPVFSAQGQLLGGSIIATDISAKKQMERQLRESETLSRGMLDSLVCFAGVLSTKGTVTHANQAALRFAGLTVDDVRGKRLEDTYWFCHSPEVQSTIRNVVEKAQRGESSRLDVQARVAGRDLIVVDFQIVCLKDDTNKITHLIASGFDVTARVSYQEQLVAAVEQAHQASLAKSRFLATMSHELRTPLNGILGMAELLSGTELSSIQRRYVELCRSSGDLLLALISDVLDFSKIEAGKLQLDESVFDLEDLITRTVESFRHRAEFKNISLSLDFIRSLDIPVWGDCVRLQQILVNLIGNSLKFTEQGEIRVEVDCHFGDGNQVALHLSVTDTGIGISEAHQAEVFELFNQVDPSSTRNYEGSGLGLAITKRIVTLMGGSIEVESCLGKGSTFSVKVFLSKINAGSDESVESQPVNMSDKMPLPSASILIAEDNSINQIYMTELLCQLGSRCECVSDGETVLAMVKDNDFDLIIMDLQMPVMDGIEATRAIREWEDSQQVSQRVPIIGLTANAMKEDRDNCLNSGMDDFLTKPVTKVQVEAILRKYAGPTSEVDPNFRTTDAVSLDRKFRAC